MASSWVPDEDNNLAYYFKESNPDRKVIFDLKYFDQIKSEVKIRIETGFAYKSISRWPLRTFVWKYILHKDIPDGHQVIVINGNVLDVRESNLRLFKKSPDYTNRPLSIHRQYDDNLAALHDPTATVLTHGDNKIIIDPSTVFDLVNSRYNIVMAQMKAILPKPTYEFIIKSGGINSRI